jgi:two-component system, OmpR family, response regulator BaeR
MSAKKPLIMVVEDEVKISDAICKYLHNEGFDTHPVNTGADVLPMFKAIDPQLIILDLSLPQMDGTTLCRNIRAISDVPIIILTARTEDNHRILGFTLGADDYVCKPFNPHELMARVKAILRRTQLPANDQQQIALGSVILYLNEYVASIDGESVELTPMECSILTALMSNPHHVFSRDELLTACRGQMAEAYDRTIDFHIKNLRKKINSRSDKVLIKSVYGAGYKFY